MKKPVNSTYLLSVAIIFWYFLQEYWYFLNFVKYYIEQILVVNILSTTQLLYIINRLFLEEFILLDWSPLWNFVFFNLGCMRICVISKNLYNYIQLPFAYHVLVYSRIIKICKINIWPKWHCCNFLPDSLFGTWISISWRSEQIIGDIYKLFMGCLLQQLS